MVFIEDNYKEKPHVKHTARSGFVTVFVCFTGIVLTLSFYMLAGFFTAGIVEDEYQSITNKTTQYLVDAIDDLKNTIELTSGLVATVPAVRTNGIPAKISEAVPDLRSFESVFYLRPQNQTWTKQVLHSADSGQGGSDEFDDLFARASNIQKLLLLKPFLSDGAFFTSNLQGLNQKSFDTLSLTTLSKPIVVVAPVERDNPASGLVVGITALNKILDLQWLNEVPFLSRIQVVDLNSSDMLFDLQSKNFKEMVQAAQKNIYQIETGQEKWEVSVSFFKHKRLFIVENISSLILIFGLLLTASATFYARLHTHKSRELYDMNQELEDKNLDLQQEVRERENIFETLQRSERENRAIIDSVSDIIFETDERAHLTFISAAWKKITGFSVKQSLGTSLFSLLNPDEINQHKKEFLMLLEGQKQPFTTFTKLRTSEGHFRAVELSFSVIRQDANENIRVVGTIKDIEERRKAEQALSAAEKKYRNIVENSPNGIYQLTPEGIYLSANKAFSTILGYEDSSHILDRIKNANSEVYCNARERIQFVRALEENGVMSNHEAEIFREDGSRIWINESARVVYDDTGKILYYEGSIEEITERKMQEAMIHKAKVNSDLANRAKSEFLANMSHELRTPLNSIIGFSDVIKSESFGALGADEYKEYAANIHDSGQRLLNIITEILDISKIEAGERALQETQMDVAKVIGSCLDLLSSKIEDAQIDVTNMLQGVPKLRGEELAVKQIAMNLMSNAIKFTPTGGRITLSYDVDTSGKLRISFTDTGIGLDEDEIEKALSPFGQVDNELSRSNSGTGLGLTLVDSLMRLHDGKLELFSQKGIGTTASIVFPVERITVPKETDSKIELSS